MEITRNHFCELFLKKQKYLQEMVLRRLRDIAKKTSFFRYVRPRRLKDVTQNTSFLRYTRDVLKTSQKSPLFRDVSKRSLKCLS